MKTGRVKIIVDREFAKVYGDQNKSRLRIWDDLSVHDLNMGSILVFLIFFN